MYILYSMVHVHLHAIHWKCSLCSEASSTAGAFTRSSPNGATNRQTDNAQTGDDIYKDKRICQCVRQMFSRVIEFVHVISQKAKWMQSVFEIYSMWNIISTLSVCTKTCAVQGLNAPKGCQRRATENWGSTHIFRCCWADRCRPIRDSQGVRH